METNDEFQERIQREQRLTARLRLATERLEDVQRERIWAVVESHQSGLSIRQIAAATVLSSSRVHQLLGSDEAREIPRWLSQQRRRGRPSQSDVPTRLADELEALRRCREWLERLDRGERVMVNLRPETDPETEYVAFDRPRVLRVLARIIADLDELAVYPPIAEDKAVKGDGAEARRARHRRRLAEPDPPPKRRLSRKNGRPYGTPWAFRLTSEGGEPHGPANRGQAFLNSGRSRKRSVKRDSLVSILSLLS